MSGSGGPGGLAVVAAVAAAASLWLALAPSRRRLPPAPSRPAGGGPGAVGGVALGDDGRLRRGRWWWGALAGAGAAALLGGPLALPVGVAVAVGVARAAGRLEPPSVRARREAIRRDLPAVVTLLAAALRSGAAPLEGLEITVRALPGPAADRLGAIAGRLRLGADPATVWRELADDDVLGSLGRALARSHATGAPVVGAVERLGADLARLARAEVEDRARTVGVRAAVPLGVCLLPAFVLLGVVPLAVSLATALA